MKFRYIVPLFLVIAFSCKQNTVEHNNNHIDTEKVDSLLVNVLEKYGRKSRLKSEVIGDTLFIKLYVYSPSFLDKETHSIILALVNYEMYSYLKNYNVVKYNYVDEGFENDPGMYRYDSVNIINIYSNFTQNITFKNMLRYSLQNLAQDELLRCNVIIQELNRIMPEEFDFKGSFWKLLEVTSKQKEELNKYFVIFSRAASIEASQVNSKHFSEIEAIYRNTK